MKFDFDPRGVETVYQLSLIKRLFQTLEAELAGVQAQTILELEQEYTIDSQEAYDEMRSIVGGQENHHEEEARALRSAELVRLYMLLEKELTRFCSAIKKSHGQGKDLADFKGRSLIQNAKALLCDHAHLVSPADPIWAQLNDFRIVRVHLVHASGDNPNKKARNEFTELVLSRPELGLSDGYELTLERQTCDQFHEIVSHFFESLFNAVGWRFRQSGSIIMED